LKRFRRNCAIGDHGLFRAFSKLAKNAKALAKLRHAMASLAFKNQGRMPISAASKTPPEIRPSKVERAMLFVFSKPNFVQIAWNSKAPKNQSRERNVVMDAPFGPLGLIRTSNVG
jgi:hypothetical protein